MVTFKEKKLFKEGYIFQGRFLSMHLRKLRCELSAEHVGL